MIQKAIFEGGRCPVCRKVFLYTKKQGLYEAWRCDCGTYVRRDDGKEVWHANGERNVCNHCGIQRQTVIVCGKVKYHMCGCAVSVVEEAGVYYRLPVSECPNTIEAINFLSILPKRLDENAVYKPYKKSRGRVRRAAKP